MLTIEQLLASDPIDPIDTDEDDLALMQLTSGSTGSPKAVHITHRNIYSNAEAMFIGAKMDPSGNDVMLSWLPCFHDMGMVGFLTVPMYFGVELVKVTPMDFLRDTLLWAKLIDKYGGTMTAAPNFAYALFAKRLRNQATPGQFDLSTLRFALSGAEPVDPADVEDLIDAGKPFGLRPEAVMPAYGMAETTLAVSFSELGDGLVVDEVDADLLAALRRAVPATKGNTRRLASLGPLLTGIEARIVDDDGAVLPTRGVGVIELRGEPLTPGYTTMGGFIPAQDENGWYDTGDLGYLMENGHIVVCGRVKDVIIMAGRNIYPTDIERAAGRVAGVRPGCAVAVRLDAGHARESFAVAVESNAYQDPAEVRRIEHQVAHEVVSEVDLRPRNVVVLGPGTIPKTPSGKLRRATSVTLVTLAVPEGAERLPGVDPVLGRLQPEFDEQLGGVGGLLAQRGNLGAFGGSEVLQHECRRILAPRRSTDADPHPLKVLGAQRGYNRAQPVVTTLAAADLQSDLTEVDIQVVVNDHVRQPRAPNRTWPVGRLGGRTRS